MGINSNLAEVAQDQPINIRSLINSIRLAYANGLPATKGPLDNQLNAVFNDPNIPEIYREMYEAIAMVFNLYRHSKALPKSPENENIVEIDYWEGIRTIVSLRDHTANIRILARQILAEDEEPSIAEALVTYAKYLEGLVESITLANIPYTGEINMDKLGEIRKLPRESLERIHFPVGWLSLVMGRLAIEKNENLLPRLNELNISELPTDVNQERLDFADDIIQIFRIPRTLAGEFIPDPEINAQLQVRDSLDEVAKSLINFYNGEPGTSMQEIRKAIFSLVDELDAIVPPDWEYHFEHIINSIESKKGLLGLKLDTRNNSLRVAVDEQLRYIRRGIEDSIGRLSSNEFEPENISDITKAFKSVVQMTKYHLRLPAIYLYFAEETVNALLQPEP